MRLFISCVSAEFRSYRLRLANQLGALRGEPVKVVVQEDFQQGGFELLRTLADFIRVCDQVVHLVGDTAGWCPEPEHERALLRYLGEPDTVPTPGLSYTQWEYRLARRFGKPVLVYRAMPAAPRDTKVTPDDLQMAHIAAMDREGEQWTPMTSSLQLAREVCRDLGRLEDRRIDNLPYDSIGSLFKGRDALMEELRKVLGEFRHTRHGRAAAIVSKEVEMKGEDGKPAKATVHGLGGVGKTRAAIEYGRRHADEFTALLFVRADSVSSLQDNLAALCGPAVFDLPEQNVPETEKRVAAALDWLMAHPGWFLVFDNVDTKEAADEVERIVGRICPKGHAAGQVLITSRLSNWSRDVTPLEIDILDLDAAAEFLLERTDERRRKLGDAEDKALAREVAELLGQLALALEQAGALIQHQRLTFAEYRDLWRTRQARVLEWFDERVMKYPKSVAITWQTSFDQLTPLAQRLLGLVSWYAPAPIPESLLAVPIPGETIDPFDLLEALANLETFSLARRSREAATPTFTVHRVVQDVVRLRNASPGTAGLRTGDTTSLQTALRWINAAFIGDPQDVRTWPTLDPLLAHAQTCAERADKAGIAEPTARLMNQLGMLLQAKARLAEAEPLMRRALAIDEASYGKDHPAVAIRLNNLAALLQATNRLAEAEPLMRRALSIDEASYGTDHPNVATALNNLAQLLQATNRLAEAEPLMRRALTIDEASYGMDHPRLATRLNNLAALLQDTNRLAEAEPLIRRALAIDEASYGKEHPDVARDVNNLAQLLKATNRLAEAEPLMRRVVQIYEVSLGTDHPSVATALNNLATLLQATNRLAEAEPLMRRALAIDEASYGKDHPNVAIRLNNLAQLLKATNRLAEAEPLMRRVVQIFEASLGTDHPNVATAISNLAQLLKATNRLAEAEPLMCRALAIDEASYGNDHPKVAIRLNNIAQLLKATNHLAEAEPLMRRALAIDEASYGKDHPEVATDLNNLAQLLKDTNRPAEAEPLMRRMVRIFVRFQKATGHEHPHVRAAINNYAIHLMKMGRTKDEAIAAIRAVYEEVARGSE